MSPLTMNRLYYILAEDGRTPVPVDDVLTWGHWFESTQSGGVRDGARVLAQTEIPGGMVSTVFLGLDHSFGDGPPVLWETMVFMDGESVDMDRYSTYDDARRGHGAVVAERTPLAAMTLGATKLAREIESLTCPHCGRTSFNPHDIRERYCGECHVFLDDVREAQ